MFFLWILRNNPFYTTYEDKILATPTLLEVRGYEKT